MVSPCPWGSCWGLSRTLAVTYSQGLGSWPFGTSQGSGEWAQFLNAQQIDQLARVVDDYGVNVVCYGLRTDFQSHLFEGSRRLLEIADTIDEVKSTCSCGRKTIINARIDSSGNIVTDGDQVEIGGDDKYVALCRSCWRNRRIESTSRNALKFEGE